MILQTLCELQGYIKIITYVGTIFSVPEWFIWSGVDSTLKTTSKSNFVMVDWAMILTIWKIASLNFSYLNTTTHYYRRCLWCNGYRRRKWTQRHEFKSWTSLTAFHIAQITLGKVRMQSFSLQLWVNSKVAWVIQPLWGNLSEFKPVKLRLKIDLVSYPARAFGLVNMDNLLSQLFEYENEFGHMDQRKRIIG